MKTSSLLVVAVLGLSTPLLTAADSERTAEYILTTPQEFEGKEVELDVSFVKPVRWKSPVPELTFFQAFTIDRKDRKPGGVIPVAVPASDAAAFAKKYGTDFDGRNDKDDLNGTLLASPGSRGRMQVWFIDTSGMAAEFLKQGKLSLEEDGKGNPEGPMRPRGPKHRGGEGAPEGAGPGAPQ